MSSKNTTDLIAALAQDNKPTRKMWPVWATILFILSATAFYCLSCVTMLYGFKNEVISALQTVIMQADILSAIFFAVVTLSLTLRSAIPGQEHQAKTAVKVGSVSLLLLLSINIAFGEWRTSTDYTFLISPHCFLYVAMLSLFPVILTFAAIKRAAPTDLKNTGRAAVLSTMFIGYAATRLSCEIDGAAHGLFTHIIPLAVYGLIGFVVGKRFLRW